MGSFLIVEPGLQRGSLVEGMSRGGWQEKGELDLMGIRQKIHGTRGVGPISCQALHKGKAAQETTLRNGVRFPEAWSSPRVRAIWGLTASSRPASRSLVT